MHKHVGRRAGAREGARQKSERTPRARKQVNKENALRAVQIQCLHFHEKRFQLKPREVSKLAAQAISNMEASEKGLAQLSHYATLFRKRVSIQTSQKGRGWLL